MLIKEAARNEADNVLHQALGAEAGFRSGQWEAIAPLLDPGARRLVVCEESWHRFCVDTACPVEFGSQTANSALIGDAARVVSL